MNWTKAAALAEIISSVAILATLVYLAIQTQQVAIQTEQLVTQTEQNTSAILASTRQAIVSADIELLLDRANATRSHLWYKPEPLTQQEKTALTTDMIAFIRLREHEWFQYQSGILDSDTWETYRGAIGGNLSSPRSRYWWEQASQIYFDPDFVAHVNDYLSTVAIQETAEDFFPD